MYLDSWPTRFGDLVHVLEPAQWVQGPWNTTRFNPAAAACFHFHGLRTLRGRDVLLTETYPIYRDTRQLLYEPYLQDLAQALQTLRETGLPMKPQLDRPLWRQRFRVAAKYIYLLSRGFLTRPTSKFGTLA